MLYELSIKSLISAPPGVSELHLETPARTVGLPGSTKIQIKGWTIVENKKIDIFIRERSETATDECPVFQLKKAHATIYNDQSKYDLHFEVGADLSRFNLGFSIEEGEIHWLYHIQITPQPEVIKGTYGWLFLGADTNLSTEQYMGRYPISEAQISNWRNHLATLDSISTELKFAWAFYIAPSKENLFEDYYPYTKAESTAIEDFVEALNGFPQLKYPVEKLRYERDLAYWKGDTHWTDYGASIAAEELLKHFNIIKENENLTHIKYRIEKQHGDLGCKLTPPIKHSHLIADLPNVMDDCVFDNHITNIGRVWIFEPKTAKTTKTCVIFGGSSSVSLLRFLILFYRRIVFLHTVATYFMEVLKHENPDNVILQTSSRFIHSCPTKVENTSLGQVLRAKINRISDSEVQLINLKVHNQNEAKGSIYFETIKNELLLRTRSAPTNPIIRYADENHKDLTGKYCDFNIESPDNKIQIKIGEIIKFSGWALPKEDYEFSIVVQKDGIPHQVHTCTINRPDVILAKSAPHTSVQCGFAFDIDCDVSSKIFFRFNDIEVFAWEVVTC